MLKILAALAIISVATVADEDVPAGIISQLPHGYKILASARLSVADPGRVFEIVALGRRDEHYDISESPDAPARPLLIFERKSGRFVQVGRNDHVVLKADEGGQCDPFLDGGIATKGRYFTVENGVACGQHWTDYITFRLDKRTGTFVFDNERDESWVMNPSDDPNGEPLVRDGPQRISRDRPGHITPFSEWRPTG